jgi:hypothetical protein
MEVDVNELFLALNPPVINDDAIEQIDALMAQIPEHIMFFNLHLVFNRINTITLRVSQFLVKCSESEQALGMLESSKLFRENIDFEKFFEFEKDIQSNIIQCVTCFSFPLQSLIYEYIIKYDRIDSRNVAQKAIIFLIKFIHINGGEFTQYEGILLDSLMFNYSEDNDSIIEMRDCLIFFLKDSNEEKLAPLFPESGLSSIFTINVPNIIDYSLSYYQKFVWKSDEIPFEFMMNLLQNQRHCFFYIVEKHLSFDGMPDEMFNNALDFGFEEMFADKTFGVYFLGLLLNLEDDQFIIMGQREDLFLILFRFAECMHVYDVCQDIIKRYKLSFAELYEICSVFLFENAENKEVVDIIMSFVSETINDQD